MIDVIRVTKLSKQKKHLDMNKIRVVGLVLIGVGIIIQFTLENDASAFVSGLLIGVGLGFLFTGRIGKAKS